MTYSGNYSPGASGDVSRAEHLKPIAWYDETAGGFLHRVGTKKANGFGLYDMIGNIDELCLDRYSIDCGIGDADVTVSVFEDPQGPASGDERVYRGSYCLFSYVTMYSAARHPKQQWYGARLMCPVGLLFPAAEKIAPAQ
jgi:formylglycine-generating enzyme required for sulfatase activity